MGGCNRDCDSLILFHGFSVPSELCFGKAVLFPKVAYQPSYCCVHKFRRDEFWKRFAGENGEN